MCENNNNTACCLSETLSIIAKIQKCQAICDNNTCDRPYLGGVGSSVCYNTRPITLYTCCTGEAWSMPYTINGTTGASTIFRVENVDDCCATFRVLAPNPVPDEIYTFVATTSFFTVNLKCFSALNCLPDTVVNCI